MSALAASPLVIERTPRMMRLALFATSLRVASKPMPEFFEEGLMLVLRHLRLFLQVMCSYRASDYDGLASEIDVVGPRGY